MTKKKSDQNVTQTTSRRKGNPKSVEQVFAPGLVGAAQIANDLPVDVQVISLRAFEQAHADIIEPMVAFAIVTGAAAGDEIIPARIAAARARGNVIERQLGRRQHFAAILAGVVIAQENIFARQALALKGDVNVFDEANDRRRRHRKARRMQPVVQRAFFGVRHAFQNEDDGATHGANVDRLKRCVEYQNARVHLEIEL